MTKRSDTKFETPYDAGYHAGFFGANTFNSHFSFFSTKERMQEWNRGNKAGSAKREADEFEQRKLKLKKHL